MRLTAPIFKLRADHISGLVAHGDIPPELVAHDNPLLQQKMKPRHLQMIAVGGSIGTGLFVSYFFVFRDSSSDSTGRFGFRSHQGWPRWYPYCMDRHGCHVDQRYSGPR